LGTLINVIQITYNASVPLYIVLERTNIYNGCYLINILDFSGHAAFTAFIILEGSDSCFGSHIINVLEINAMGRLRYIF